AKVGASPTPLGGAPEGPGLPAGAFAFSARGALAVRQPGVDGRPAPSQPAAHRKRLWKRPPAAVDVAAHGGLGEPELSGEAGNAENGGHSNAPPCAGSAGMPPACSPLPR